MTLSQIDLPQLVSWLGVKASLCGVLYSSQINLPQLVSWLLLGLLAGAIARALTPGDDKSGCLATIVLGIAGAFVGGWIGNYIGFLPETAPNPRGWNWAPSIGSLITSTVGAIVLLSLFRWMRK